MIAWVVLKYDWNMTCHLQFISGKRKENISIEFYIRYLEYVITWEVTQIGFPKYILRFICGPNIQFIKYVKFRYLFWQTTYWTTHHLNDGRIYVFSTIKSVILKFACKDVVNFTPQNDVGFMVVPNIGLHISSPYSS